MKETAPAHQVESQSSVVYNTGGILAVWPKRGALKLANQTGKRYICSQCGSEFIVTKGGTGSIICCTQQMELKR